MATVRTMYLFAVELSHDQAHGIMIILLFDIALLGLTRSIAHMIISCRIRF